MIRQVRSVTVSGTIWVLGLFASGCVPSLPPFVQNLAVPQAFEWQHKDLSAINFESTRNAPAHRGRATLELFREVTLRLDALEFQPRDYSGIKATLILSVPERDLERRIRDQAPETAGRWGRYADRPAFESVSIRVEPGVSLAGVAAVQAEGAPGVILVPGSFDGRDALYVRDTALLCHRFGYNVLVLEARNHGQSFEHWITLGWKEGRDIVAAARWLRAQSGASAAGDEGPSVAVIGYSLGGWYALRAAYDASVDRQEHVLSGGVICFNPPVDIRQTALDLGSDEYRGSEFTLRNQILKQFEFYLESRIRALDVEEQFEAAGGDFDAYAELAARTYGIDREELYHRAVVPAAELAASVRVPVIVFHAEDDPIVDMKHVTSLRRAVDAEGSDYIGVIIREKGGHIALNEVDPQYYVDLILTVLEGLKRQG